MRKQYGESQIDRCPFCNKQALSLNNQKIPVCRDHKSREITAVCVCGALLDMKKGKYGPFFVCASCGPQSLKKVLSVNSQEVVEKKEKKEITVRSDDARYF